MERLYASLFYKRKSLTIQEKTNLSCIVLFSTWLFFNIASEVLEDYSNYLDISFAFAQYLVLRRYIKREGLAWWVLFSVSAWIVAFVLIVKMGLAQWLVGLLFGGFEQELAIANIVLIMALIRSFEWFVIGGAQWLIFMLYIRKAYWWVVASALGGAVKGGSEYIISSMAGSLPGTVSGMLGYSLITGIALVLFLRPYIFGSLQRQSCYPRVKVPA